LACDSIAAWWDQHGRSDYPEAKKMLVLFDGGGSNSATMYLFKEDLQKLVNRLGIEIRVAHYPPYCSKHNPIEHRLFPHLTRACRGVIFQGSSQIEAISPSGEWTLGKILSAAC
jgi:Rhodopirellula transposase DDE domain